MNERGVGVLVSAALKGVRQIKGRYHDERGGHCGIGVLHEAIGERNDMKAAKEFGIDDEQRMACPMGCETRLSELAMIAHLNDDHDADFLTIARKLGPDASGSDATK